MAYAPKDRRGRGWWSYMQYCIRTFPSYGDDVTVLEAREKAAVEFAIHQTQRRKDGAQRLLMVDMVYWSRTHNVIEAAAALGVSYQTARRWSGDFIKATAWGFFGDQLLPHKKEDPYHSKRRT